jgi:hypothetical protein
MDTSNRQDLLELILKGMKPVQIDNLDLNERLMLVNDQFQVVKPHLNHCGGSFKNLNQWAAIRAGEDGHFESHPGWKAEITGEKLTEDTRLAFLCRYNHRCDGEFVSSCGYRNIYVTDLFITQKGELIMAEIFYSRWWKNASSQPRISLNREAFFLVDDIFLGQFLSRTPEAVITIVDRLKSIITESANDRRQWLRRIEVVEERLAEVRSRITLKKYIM